MLRNFWEFMAKWWRVADEKQKKQNNKKQKANNIIYNPKFLTFAFLNIFQSYKFILIDNISVTVTLFLIFEISRKLKNYEQI